MGSARVTLCAGFLVAIALAPTAYAQDGQVRQDAQGGGVSVSPSSPVPGGDVAMRVSGCAQRTGIAVSAAFVADIRLTGADGTLVGESQVRSTLTAGTYDVKVSCGGTDRTGTITVGQPPSGYATAPPPSPVAPVHAGGGGTAPHLAAVDARAAGPGTGQAVTGLVLAGAAAVAVALRSARRGRRTD